MTLVIHEDHALLKGNADTVKMVRKNDYFIETTGGGNLNLWRLARGTGEIPTYLFVMKAYTLTTPASFTDVYLCSK